MKFLIDECLSPKLATIARARGFPESTHVTWLGLRSRQDWAIVRRAVDDGYVLVTNDSADFTSLMEREPVHPGLICLNMALAAASTSQPPGRPRHDSVWHTLLVVTGRCELRTLYVR